MNRKEAKKKKKRAMLIATLGTAALIVGGLTFAWYSSQDSVTNTFKTSGNLKTVVVENFTPPTNWQPGVTTDKVVQVTNTGTIDAYTRVRFDEILTYYKDTGNPVQIPNKVVEGDTENADSDTSGSNADSATEATTLSPYVSTAVPYVEVDADAIDRTVDTWNSDTNHDKWSNGGYVKLVATNFAGDDDVSKALASLAATVPDGATIYVKRTFNGSQDSDKQLTENGYNYEFLGYYDTGYVVSSTNTTNSGTAANGTSAERVCYEMIIEPTFTDSQKVTTVSGTSNVVTHDYIPTALACYVKEAKKITVTDKTTSTDKADEGKTIADYVELEFNTNGKTTVAGATQSDWYFNNGWYYYRATLESGQSTTPLLNAVRFKDSVEDVINATYELTVISESTQATENAFTDMWGDSLSTVTDYYGGGINWKTIITELENPKAKITPTNITLGIDADKQDCEYSKVAANKSVCIDETGGNTSYLMNLVRGKNDDYSTDVTNARKTVTESITETTTATATEPSSESESTSGEG
jgi:alternate signal-mediated exported protein